MRWVGFIACMKETGNITYTLLASKTEVNVYYGGVGVNDVAKIQK
jgi:hypothetical protein